MSNVLLENGESGLIVSIVMAWFLVCNVPTSVDAAADPLIFGVLATLMTRVRLARVIRLVSMLCRLGDLSLMSASNWVSVWTLLVCVWLMRRIMGCG